MGLERDAVVVGAGIAGAGVAAALAQAGASVLLVDQRRAGEGATGRNAGLVLADGADCHARMVVTHGRAVADALREVGLATRRLVRDLATRHDIGWHGSGSLRLALEEREAADLEATAGDLGLTFLGRAQLPAPWRGGPWQGALVDEGDGVVQPLALLDAVLAEARGAGASLVEGVPVGRVLREAGTWCVPVGDRVVRTPHVVLAASMGTDRLLPRDVPPLDLVPARAQMLAARVRPRPPALRPVYARDGYDYLRVLPTGTVLLGGCRDADLAREQTEDERPDAVVQAALDHLLARFMAHADRARVMARWAGTMAFAPDGLPRAGPWPGAEGLHVLTALSGHGMGWGLGLAAGVAGAILGTAGVPAALDARRRLTAAGDGATGDGAA